MPRSLQVNSYSPLHIFLALWLALTPGFAYAGSLTLLGVGGPAAAAYSGPGDIVSGASVWWGLRAYNAAYATGSNPAAVVCDSATFTTCSTINILSNGKFDAATASGSAACATACVVKSLTDQTGNGKTLSCASAAVCPVLQFNCIGSLPCMNFSGSILMTFSALSPTTGFTVSAVYERTASFTTVSWICCNTTATVLFGNPASANVAAAYDGGSITNFTMSDSNAHALTVVYNGASSQGVVDGTATAIAAIGTTGGTVQQIGKGNNQAAASSNLFEIGIWTSTIFSSGQYTGSSSVSHNQCSYWGTPTSC
jgi:hypothetical protein